MQRMRCCICKERGHQIHHIDGNSANTILDNLAFLCQPCHEDAGTTSPTRRKLTPKLVRKFRDEYVAHLKAVRDSEIKAFDKPLAELSQEILIQATITAAALLDIERIGVLYTGASGEERDELIGRMNPYVEFMNMRIAFALMGFIESAAHLTRNNLSESDTGNLVSLAMHWFPYSKDKQDQAQYASLARHYVDAGSTIAYDAAIHLGDYKIALWGLYLLKFIHGVGEQFNLPEIKDHVENSYAGLQRHLIRPERNDLELFKKMFEEFRLGIGNGSHMMPNFSPDILKVVL